MGTSHPYLPFYQRANTIPPDAREPARGAAKRWCRYITADRINHALFREVAPSRAEPRCAALTRRKTRPSRALRHASYMVSHWRVFSRTERDDGAQAARSDTSSRYSRAVYHGGRGYIGEEGWGRATTRSAASPWLLCALPPGNRTMQGPFSRRPANSRHVRAATRRAALISRMGQVFLTTLHFCNTGRSIRYHFRLFIQGVFYLEHRNISRNTHRTKKCFKQKLYGLKGM